MRPGVERKTSQRNAPGGNFSRLSRRLTGDLPQHIVQIGVFSRFLLGMDEGVPHGYFVDATTRWDECHMSNTLMVVVQDLFRQTGGFSKVPSRRAVFDGDIWFVSHGCSLRL